MKYLIKQLNSQNRDLRSALLFTLDEKHFLFSCPDVFQRIANTLKMKFGKVNVVFIPHLKPDYFSGFTGFYLSTREQETWKPGKKILVGPPGLYDSLKNSNAFMAYWNSYLHVVELPIDLSQQNKEDTHMQDIEESKVEEEVKHEENLLKENENFPLPMNMTYSDGHLCFKEEELVIYPMVALNSQGQEPCYSYIGIPAQARGTFLPKKAKDLGCNPKQHFRPLSEGQSVTLENGTVVTPEMVIDSQIPSQVFINVFMPNEDYVDSFLSMNQNLLSKFFAENILENRQVSIVHHCVPAGVLHNEAYRSQFIHKLHPSTMHVMDCPETNKNEYARQKAFAQTSLVKQICPLLAPIANQHFTVAFDPTHDRREQLEQLLEMEKIKFEHSQIGLNYNMFPIKSAGFDRKQVISMTPELEEEITKNNQEMFVKATELLNKYIEPETIQQLKLCNSDFNDNEKDPQFLFLGTSSMKPTQYRGASAIYLFYKNHGLLMDCAEGSYGQLYDHFGDIDQVNAVILKTRCVFITHLHGDHQLGILRFIKERENLLTEHDENNKLYVVIPTPMMKWMEEFRTRQLRLPNMVVYVNTRSFNPEKVWYYQDFEGGYTDLSDDNSREKVKEVPVRSNDEVNQIINDFVPEGEKAQELQVVLKNTMNIDRLIAVEVDHCPQSYACLVQSQDFGKILYSGDTLPCQNLMNYVQNARVMIHEATLQNGMEEDAHSKKHSTTQQAIEIGEKCGVWRTILTHFSPRYQKIAEVTDMHLEKKTLIAFDHTRVKLSHLEWAYKFLALYRELLTNDDDEDSQEDNQNNNNKQKNQKKQKNSKQKDNNDEVAQEPKNKRQKTN